MVQQMTAVALTPAEVGVEVGHRLDGWDLRVRTDVDVDGCRLQVAVLDSRTVYVEYGAVPVDRRQGGYGTALIAALTGWADQQGVVLRLGISGEYGMPVRVLRAFYAGHGFVAFGRLGSREMVRHPVAIAGS